MKRVCISLAATVALWLIAVPAAHAQNKASCQVYEIKATDAGSFDKQLPKPLQKKLSRGAFRQWKGFALLHRRKASLSAMKPHDIKLSVGKLTLMLRGVTVYKGKKHRLSLQLQINSAKGRRLQDTTTSIDSGDSILIVDGRLKVAGGSYILASTCTAK